MRTVWLLLAVLPFALIGCRAEEKIEQYDITHADREKLELRVAIVPQEEDVWFFHLSGPEAEVNRQGKVLEEMVKTIRFVKKDDKDEPPITWTEPTAKEWVKEKAVGERVASYRIEAPKPMEMKVTRFQADKYTLTANLHRWQQKLNLPLTEKADEHKYATVTKVGDLEVTWVKLTGLGVHALSKPMPMQAKKKRPMAPPPMPERKGDVPFEYETPKGWQQKPAQDGITRLLFEIPGPNAMAKVTFTAVGGELAGNINRWRGQVGLPKVPDAEAVRSAKEMKIAGVNGFYVDIANPNSPSPLGRIVVAIVPLGQTNWFIRLSGPHDWVGQNVASFETFVKSLKRGE